MTLPGSNNQTFKQLGQIQGHSCSLQRGSGGREGNTEINIIECGEVELVPAESLYPYILVSLMIEGRLSRYDKEKPGH